MAVCRVAPTKMTKKDTPLTTADSIGTDDNTTVMRVRSAVENAVNTALTSTAAEPNTESTGVMATDGTSDTPAMYFIEFESNNSKKWDRKVIAVECAWLKRFYNISYLKTGATVRLPWSNKQGNEEYWNTRLVDEPTSTRKRATRKRKQGTVSYTK